MDNAVRYTPAGGSVDVSTVIDGTVALVVADDGPGVSQDELSRLTERFYRGSNGGEGTGLGLAIVDAICARHGLSLELANRPRGTGFLAKVTFPDALRG